MPSRRPGPEGALLLLARLALAALFVPCGLGKLADLAGFATGLERLLRDLKVTASSAPGG